MANDTNTTRDQYENYRYCLDNGHSNWLARAKRCFDYWNSKQWDAAVKARLNAEGRPAMTFNIVESLVRAMLGVHRALRNDVRFTPVYDASAESSRVMDAIWLHTQQQNQFEFLETDVYQKGLIMDCAYFEAKIDYDDSLRGHIRITSPRSQDVIRDPSIESYDPREWPQVMKRRWVSVNDIDALYGKAEAEAVARHSVPSWMEYEDQFLAHQMGALPYYHHGALSDSRSVRAHLLLERQYRTTKMKDVFVDLATGDVSEIPESWDRNRISRVLEMTPGLGTMRKRMNTVRWTVTCDGELLHDEDSPYRDFTIVPYFPSFIDGVAQGAVWNLLDPQDLYNKMTSQELHIINTTANSGLKVKQGSVKNMTLDEMKSFGSKSGIVFEMDDINNMEKIQPNQLPQGHEMLSQKADSIMRNIAGVSNQGRGFAREDVAADAILANQAAQDVNSAGWLANLNRTKQLLARNVLDLAQAHYTDTRAIMINRGSMYRPDYETLTLNEPTPEGTMLNDVTRGSYGTALVPSPARTTLSESDFKLLLELRKLGIGIPDALLVELSPASNKAQIIEGLQGDSNERQRAAEEAQAQAAQIQQQKDLAAARKEEAAAMLNQARAEKASVEAAVDPDATYERVEMARIEAERERSEGKLRLEYDKLDAAKNNHSNQLALRLAEMDHNRDTAVAAAKAKPAATPQRDKKPGLRRKQA